MNAHQAAGAIVADVYRRARQVTAILFVVAAVGLAALAFRLGSESVR